MHNVLEKLHRVAMKQHDPSDLYRFYDDQVVQHRQALHETVGAPAQSELATLMDHCESLRHFASLDGFRAGFATGFALAYELAQQMPDKGLAD